VVESLLRGLPYDLIAPNVSPIGSAIFQVVVQITPILVPILDVMAEASRVGPAVNFVIREVLAVPSEIAAILTDVGALGLGRIQVSGLHILAQLPTALSEVAAVGVDVAAILTDVVCVLSEVPTILANVLVITGEFPPILTDVPRVLPEVFPVLLQVLRGDGRRSERERDDGASGDQSELGHACLLGAAGVGYVFVRRIARLLRVHASVRFRNRVGKRGLRTSASSEIRRDVSATRTPLVAASPRAWKPEHLSIDRTLTAAVALRYPVLGLGNLRLLAGRLFEAGGSGSGGWSISFAVKAPPHRSVARYEPTPMRWQRWQSCEKSAMYRGMGMTYWLEKLEKG
jgi:hypothetical protein